MKIDVAHPFAHFLSSNCLLGHRERQKVIHYKGWWEMSVWGQIDLSEGSQIHVTFNRPIFLTWPKLYLPLVIWGQHITKITTDCWNIYCLLLSLVVAAVTAQFAVARVAIHHSDATEIRLSDTRQGGLTVQAAKLSSISPNVAGNQTRNVGRR